MDKNKSLIHIAQFHKELNKSLRTAFLAAFGFLIALTWRDVITEFVNKISASSPIQGRLMSAVTITLICVLGILIVARVFSDEK